MANLTLKNLPHDVHQRLRQRAERNRRSLNQEAIDCLRAATSAHPVDVEDLLVGIRSARGNVRGRFSPATIRSLRERGRK